MSLPWRTGLASLLLLAACGGQPASPPSGGEALSGSPAVRSITEGVERFELENDLTLIVRPVEGAPATALVTRVKTGYFHEPDELAGISHVVEHMFFNGTTSRPGTEDVSRETKALGGVLNASTAYDNTTYYAVLPTANWRAGMEIQADALQNPLFDAAVLENEMGAIKQEARRKLDSPGAYGRESMFALAHEKHRIRRWRIGTEEVLDTIDRDALVRWFEDHYRPSNIILTVVGDVDPQEVRSAVEELYGSMPRGHLRQRGGPAEPSQKTMRYRRMNGQLKQAYLFVGFPSPGVGHADNAALDILATMLGSGRSSRLSLRMRDELGAVTSVNAMAWQYEDAGMFEINAVCDPLNLEMSTRELFVEIERLRHFGPTQAELDRARRILLSGQAFDLEEVLGQASALAAYEADGSYLEYDAEMRRLLAVGAEDVSRVLDRYVTIDRANILEYVPWGFSGAPPAREMRDHLDAILVAAARDFHAPQFPDAAAGIESLAARQQWSEALAAGEPAAPGVSEFALPRGGRLFVQENPVAPTTSVGIWFRGGRIQEQSNYGGVTQVLQRVMLRETLNRSREQLARELESLGSAIGTSISEDWFGFRVGGLAADLPHQLDVLFDVILQPTLSEEAFVDEIRLRKPAVEGVEDRSAAYTLDLVHGLMYGEHPYGRPAEGSMAGLLALNREIVEEFYFDQVRPETMVVVVSGDVRAGLVHEMVARYLAGWDYRRLPMPTDGTEFYSAGRLGDPAAHVPGNPLRIAERLRTQSTMVASWPTVPRAHPDRAAFAVLAEITGGLGGTFFEEIRTRRGLAYQVSTFNQSRMLAGEFSVFVACTPDSLDTVRGLVTDLTRGLASDPPTQEELDRAKAAIIGAWQIGGQTNSARAGRIATYALAGQSLEELREWPDRIQAVTLDDLRRIAATWLDRPPLATGILAGRPGSDANPDR